MKNKTILLSIFCCIIFWNCSRDTGVFAPDRVYPGSKKEGIFVTNRGENELLLLTPDLKTVKSANKFTAPVNDLICMADNRVWVVCDGVNGMMHELNGEDLAIRSSIEVGGFPSALMYNAQSGTFWVTHRFENTIKEVDPRTRKVISSVEVGREPVDMISFCSDSLLLIANNMPEMSSLSYPLGAQLSVFDIFSKKVNKRILLPNGSTDVKEMAVSDDKSYAYVTHLLSRYQLPTNQVDRGWMCTNALSIIDLKNQEWLTTVLLDTPQKGSANPWGVALSGDNQYIVVAASGVHELVSIDRAALHRRLEDVKNGIKVTPSTSDWQDIPNDAGFLYGISSYISTEGKGPRGVAAIGNQIYCSNYFTGEIVNVDLITEKKNVRPVKGTPLTATQEGKGNMYFCDASIGFQGWQSCASCHPNDARTDGLNWDLLNDGMGNSKNTKSMLFSHQTAPCMVTGIRKDAETAVRSGLKYILFSQPNEEISLAMDAYLKSLRPVPSPYLENGQLSAGARRGKELFDTNCASCHSGAYYTDMKQYRISWSQGTEENKKMDVPALNEVWRTAPYLYDGRSYSLKDMLQIHGPQENLSESELTDLAEYVLSL
ncbi:MAG: c-type cytochrome [Bacteroidales bacterium]